MWLLTQILLSLVLIIFGISIHFWFFVLNTRKKCKWMPATRRVPLLGSVFEFGSSAETLNDLKRFSNNPEKMCYIELFRTPYIASRNCDFLEFVLSSNSLIDKSLDYHFFEKWLGTGLLTAAGPKWKKRRKIITPAFHFSILEQFVEYFDTNGHKMINKLMKEAVDKESVDIYQYVTDCTLDVISESAMGVSIGTQDNKNQEYVSVVKDMCRIAVTRTFSSWKRNDFLFLFSEDYRKQRQNIQILHRFTNSVIEERRRAASNKNVESGPTDNFGRKRKLAFLDLLLNCKIDGKLLTTEDIREEVDTLMFEGHDTTASGISSALFLLSNHQEIQKKVRDEQKEIYGANRDQPTTYQMLQDMKYLDLVIKESLRLYPAVPVVGRSVKKDIEYRGNIIPEGSLIAILIQGINTDPDYHESPDDFNPDRFLKSDKSPFCYVPFSAGPRNCIGQKFAVLEMKSVISKILRYFELYPTDPPHQIEFVNEAVLKSRNGVMMKVKKHVWSK